MTDLVRWARSLQAIGQSGLTYAESAYDRDRYRAVLEIAAEIAAGVTGEDPREVLAGFAAESGYRTPKVDVRGVVLDADALLLVRETGRDEWCLPGGWADVGETPSQAVAKEVREEAGLHVQAVRILGLFDRDFRGRARWPAHVYKLYVLCERNDRAAPAADGVETEDAAFFAVDSLPDLSEKTPREQLDRALEVALGRSVYPALD